jgi:hypothetical protein
LSLQDPNLKASSEAEGPSLCTQGACVACLTDCTEQSRCECCQRLLGTRKEPYQPPAAAAGSGSAMLKGGSGSVMLKGDGSGSAMLKGDGQSHEHAAPLEATEGGESAEVPDTDLSSTDGLQRGPQGASQGDEEASLNPHFMEGYSVIHGCVMTQVEAEDPTTDDAAPNAAAIDPPPVNAAEMATHPAAAPSDSSSSAEAVKITQTPKEAQPPDGASNAVEGAPAAGDAKWHALKDDADRVFRLVAGLEGSPNRISKEELVAAYNGDFKVFEYIDT